MVTGIDPNGKIRFSRQAVFEGWTAEEAREHDSANRKSSGGGHSSSGNRRGGQGHDRPRSNR